MKVSDRCAAALIGMELSLRTRLCAFVAVAAVVLIVPQGADADLTAANFKSDLGMLAKCNDAVRGMLQSGPAYDNAALSCRAAVEYYTRKSGAQTSDAGVCFYLLRGAQASERYAYVASKSSDPQVAKKAFVVAQLALNDIVTDCSTQPNIVLAAKRVYISLQQFEPRY